MKKMTRMASILLIVCLVMSITVPIAQASEGEGNVVTGNCGYGGYDVDPIDAVKWSLDLKTGDMLISGNGPMADYRTGGAFTNAPWKRYIENYDIDNVSIKIEPGVTTIGANSFYWISEVKEVTIPDTVKEIGILAFFHCHISELQLPEGLKKIGDDAFNGSFIETVQIPATVTYIGFHAVDGDKLRSINVEKGNKNYASLNGILYTKDKNTLIQVPAAYQTERVVIPTSVTEIYQYAFSDCKNIKEVAIPKDVTKIGLGAFSWCSKLTDIYYSGTEEEWNSIEFEKKDESANKWLQQVHIHYNSSILEYENEGKVDFDRYIYQAKSLDRTEFPAIANIRATMNQDTATDLFISGLKDSGFEVAMGISDLCKLYSDSIDDVTALSDFAIEPKDLYEAVILNALEDDLDASIDVLDDQLETYLGWGKDLTSLVESTLKTNYGIDYVSGRDSLASLSTEAKQKIIETMEEEFRKKYPLISGAGDLSTGLGIVLDSVDNIEDCWNRFSSCVFARRASESVKEVVHQAYKESLKTNNFYLQSALADCVEIIDSSAAEFALRALSDTCMVAGKRSMNYLVKEIFWEDVKNSIYIALPGVAIIQCGYKGGQLVSNILFSTDNISEKYAKMKIVNSVTSVFEKASSSLKANFLNQQSSHTAQTYLSSVDFLFRLWAQDCDEAYNFVDTLDRAMISNVAKLFGSTYYNDTKDAINMKKNTYATQRSMAEVAWIDLLDEDYPNSGLSDQYQWIIDQHNESLRKKIKVACPVNVHVYDSNGKLVAYAENGRVSSTGPVTIALNDDVKTIYFYDDAKYNIQYTGTGTGDMDITVSEFDATETTARTVNFFDVPLKKSTQYSMNIESGILQDAGYTVEGERETIFHDFDSLTKDSLSSYTATIKSGAIMQDNGASTSATAFAGEALEILAYVPDGYTFVKWQSDADNNIFADAQSPNTTVRMPASNVTISAIMKSTSETTPSGGSGSGGSASTTYTLTFETNGGNAIAKVTKNKGTTIDLAQYAPTKSGATFEGWYADKGLTKKITSVKLDANTTVYAKWTEAPVSGLPFGDVKSADWFYNDVKYVYEKGMMAGTAADVFAPNATTTRAMIVTILYRLEGSPAVTGTSSFVDVPAGQWYTDAVNWAAANQIVKGTSATTFAPNDSITREQMAAILYRYAQYKGYDVTKKADLSGYSDNGQVSAYAKDALAWANAAKLINGVTNTTLAPQGNATRAQVSAILHRFCDGVVK